MTFLQELESFLLSLRDSYGFLLPVDRLRDCLVCASSIVDVEEVLYRMQSMVCTSQEQVEMFQSLFAQKFLNRQPQPAKQTPRKSSAPTTQQRLQTQLADMQRAANTLSSQRDDRKRRISELARQEQDAQDKLRRQEEIVSEIRTRQSPSSGNLEAAMQAARPNLNDKDVLKQLGNVRRSLQKLQSLCGKTPSDMRQRAVAKFGAAVEKALESPDCKKMLDSLIQKAMAEASHARTNKDTAVFQALLNTISELQGLQKAALKSIKPAEKKDLANAKKEINTCQRQLSAAEALLLESKGNLENIRISMRRAERQAKEYEERARKANRQVDDIRQRLAQARSAENPVVVKEKAIEHREEFLVGIRSVQTTAAIAELVKTDLQRMSADEKARILSYIRTNARVFRQSLRRKSVTPRKRQVDIKATARLAGRTNGEPLKIKYKEPHKSHANVVILTDISGSCRKVSELALYFMAMMENAFPGGCRKFVFVNSLIPVDRQFRDKGPDEGVQAVMDTVPSRGIYSDYGSTIATLRREYGGAIRRDTTVIIIGDARNNSHAPHDDDLKYIADRCANVLWLNPDDPHKWNTGDSIVATYEKAGAKMCNVQTVSDLLGFLSRIGN